MNSEIPRLRVLVVSFAPFLSCLKWEACWTRSRILVARVASASGNAWCYEGGFKGTFGLISDIVFASK